MPEDDWKLTPQEMHDAIEKNYHGAIQALFVQHDGTPEAIDVVEMICRRFGMSDEGLTQPLTQVQVAPPDMTSMLVEQLAAAQLHLRPDTIDWYNQRVEYLLACAAAGTQPDV